MLPHDADDTVAVISCKREINFSKETLKADCLILWFSSGPDILKPISFIYSLDKSLWLLSTHINVMWPFPGSTKDVSHLFPPSSPCRDSGLGLPR